MQIKKKKPAGKIAIKAATKKKSNKDQIKFKTYTWSPPKDFQTKMVKWPSTYYKTPEEAKEAKRKDLRDIAIFLEGMKQAKGSLNPIGSTQLESLWSVIAEMKAA